MRLRIRREESKHMAYFIDSRRIVGVDEVGAKILDLLFNQEKSVENIVNEISSEYGVATEQVRTDVNEFLQEIRLAIHPDGFNVMNQEQLEVPLGVELEITGSCNLRCIHCYQGEHPEIHMPINRAIDIVNKLVKYGVCEVSLIGGEPLRHPGLFEIIQHCYDQDLAINLITNATLIDSEWTERLASIDRLVVVISLDGIEGMHDRIRGKGVFEKVNTTLRKLKKADIPVEVTCTLNAVNASTYKEVIEYCHGLDIPCNFNLFKPFLPGQDKLVLDPEVYFDVVIDLFRLRTEEGYKIGLSNAAITSELLEIPVRDECRATRSGVVIDVMGRMVVCPSLVSAGGFDENEIPYFDDNFMETWRNHQTFEKFRSSGLRECQARALIFSGNVQGYDPYGITAFKKHRESKQQDSP